MKKKGSLIGTIVIMLIVAAVVIFMYYKASNKNNSDKVESEVTFTKLDTLLLKDMEKEYPPTAREVVKLYARILVELYGFDEISDNDLEGLVDMIRTMYSTELLEKNDREAQIEYLMTELAVYKESGVSVYDYYVEKANSSITWSDETGDYYRLIAVFALKSSGHMSRTYEQFILIKEDSKWKIHGWAIVDGEEMDAY